MTTADAARAAINSSESTPARASVPDSSNAHHHAEIAAQEMDHYINSGNNGAGDPSFTRRAAAAAMTVMDPRPFVSTKYGQVRRQFEDDGNATRRAAREALDGVTAFEGIKARPGDKAKLAANEFAADVNRSTLESTLPTNASTEAIVAEIIRRRRER